MRNIKKFESFNNYDVIDENIIDLLEAKAEQIKNINPQYRTNVMVTSVDTPQHSYILYTTQQGMIKNRVGQKSDIFYALEITSPLFKSYDDASSVLKTTYNLISKIEIIDKIDFYPYKSGDIFGSKIKFSIL